MASHFSTSQRLHKDLGRVIATTKSGGRLPSEPDLARRLGVSRATLREAMRTFETQGLIRRRQGVGTFVLRPSHVIESGLEVLESIKALANNIGLQVFCGELEVTHRLASEDEANALRLELPVEVMHVARVILAENRPVAFLVDILPENIIAPGEVTKDFTGSVLDLLLRSGDPPLINSRCEIGAVAATSDLARALSIRRGDALLRFISRLYALDGTVVDYSSSYFIPGFFRFHVVRELAEG